MQATPTPSAKVPLITKLAFGAGDIGPAMVAAITGFFLLIFFTDVARISPGTAGTILFISVIWDALIDPVIGALSDRTRSRLGRRRPWMLFGAIPFGISFYLLFLVPPFDETGKALYYLFALIFHKTMFSIVNLPYTALTPALTDDYNERTSLNSYRFGFSIVAGIVAAVLHGQLIGDPPTPQGYAFSILIWAIAGTIPFFLAVAGTYEKPVIEEERKIGFWQGLRIAAGNRAFRDVAAVYLLSWLVVQTVSTVIVYFATYWLQRGDIISGVILAVQGSAFIMLFVWARISDRIGKKRVYYYGMSFWILVSFLLFAVQPDWPTWSIYLLGALAGVGVAVAYLVPWSMLPDVVEQDELETGQRREGVFYAVFVLFQQVGVAFGLNLIGQLLEITGYYVAQPGEKVTATGEIITAAGEIIKQPDSALLVMRLLVGPIPALILLAGIYMVYRYPITKAQHEATLAALATKRQGRVLSGPEMRT